MPGAVIPPDTAAAALLAAGAARRADVVGVILRYDLCDHTQELEVLIYPETPDPPDEVHSLALCPSCRQAVSDPDEPQGGD